MELKIEEMLVELSTNYSLTTVDHWHLESRKAKSSDRGERLCGERLL